MIGSETGSLCARLRQEIVFVFISGRPRTQGWGPFPRNGVTALMAATNGNASHATELANRWSTDPRWQGIERPYTAEDVLSLRGRYPVEHTIARLGAERLWELVDGAAPVGALGAVTGGQA